MLGNTTLYSVTHTKLSHIYFFARDKKLCYVLTLLCENVADDDKTYAKLVLFITSNIMKMVIVKIMF